MRQLSDAKQWTLIQAAMLACCLLLTACTTIIPLSKESAATRLNNHDLQLITQGDNDLISIPGGALFYEHSPRIRWESYALLNDVAHYLRLYRKVSVQVSVFSNPYRSPARDAALTRARAEAVANYLWTQNIQARFIYAYGEGRYKPIIEKMAVGERSLNSRVEITFKEVVA